MPKTPAAPEGAGVTNVAELEAQNREALENWSRGTRGTATGEPPPAAPGAGDAPPTPPAQPAAPPATPPAEPPATPPAPAPAAPPPTVEEFIEALIAEAQGDTPAQVLKIPKSARIPHKVGGEIVYRPAGEALTSSMLETDYHGKTTELAEARRELEQHAAQLIADRARMEAREQWIKEERQRLRDAQKSPEAWERYQNHLRLMAEDPEYAKTFDDALDSRERKAEDAAAEAAAHQDAVRQGVAQAAAWIDEAARDPKYQYVDRERVTDIYAALLEKGQAGLDQGTVKAIFDREAQYLSSSLTPLQRELADLRAQVQRLTQTDPASVHNSTTQHALARAQVPPVVTGAPAAPAPTPRKVAPFTPAELPERNAEWARRRD